MRSLGYPLLLAATLVVAPACNKKSDDADAKADGSDKKAEGEKASSDGGKEVASAAGDKSDAVTRSLGLIPDAAQFIIGLNPKAVSSSPVYTTVAAELEQDPEYKEMITAFKDCSLDPLKFDAVLVGSSMTQDVAAIVVGDGLGDDKNAACVVTNLQKKAGNDQPAAVVDKDGKKVIEFADGRVYLVDGRTLAIVTPGWQDAVSGLIDGKGAAAGAGSKKDLLGKVDASQAIWGVATIPAELSGMAASMGMPPEAGNVKGVAASIDLSSGAAVQATAIFDTADNAKAVADQVQAILGELGGQAPPEIAPVVKTVKVEAAGADLKLALSATMDDLQKAKGFKPPF